MKYNNDSIFYVPVSESNRLQLKKDIKAVVNFTRNTNYYDFQPFKRDFRVGKYLLHGAFPVEWSKHVEMEVGYRADSFKDVLTEYIEDRLNLTQYELDDAIQHYDDIDLEILLETYKNSPSKKYDFIIKVIELSNRPYKLDIKFG